MSVLAIYWRHNYYSGVILLSLKECNDNIKRSEGVIRHQGYWSILTILARVYLQKVINKENQFWEKPEISIYVASEVTTLT